MRSITLDEGETMLLARSEGNHSLAQRYTSFDMKPTIVGIEGMYARNPEYFHVTEDISDGLWVSLLVMEERDYQKKS
jgi:hypothetical protein